MKRSHRNPADGDLSWRGQGPTPLQSAVRRWGGLVLPTDSTRTEWLELKQARKSLFRPGGSPPDELAEVLGYETDSELWEGLAREQIGRAHV